ncbi:hypothetical protein ACHAXN_010665 [Cyclotella atomus]
MSTRKSRRLPLALKSTSVGTVVDETIGSVNESPEHYKVEDRIQHGDAVDASVEKLDRLCIETEQVDTTEGDGKDKFDNGSFQDGTKSTDATKDGTISSGKVNDKDETEEPSTSMEESNNVSQPSAESVAVTHQKEALSTEAGEKSQSSTANKTAAAHPSRRNRSRSGSLVDENDGSSSNPTPTTEVTGEWAEIEGLASKTTPPAEVIRGVAAESKPVSVHPSRRHRTRSASSAAEKEAASQKAVDVFEEKKNDVPPSSAEKQTVHPIRRHRTRSTSSAMSSVSGDSQGADAAINFDNDGKTPLIADRRSKRTISVHSQGPVRKRHKSRSLFGVNSTIPNLSSDPPLFQDGLLNNESEDNVFVNLPRSRSNTIDSFRAAMDSSLNNEISESVVLPEMKTSALPETTKARSDTIDFMSKVDFLASPRGRSDTIDFLTATVGSEINGADLTSPPSPAKVERYSLPEKLTKTNATAHEGTQKAKGEIAFGKTPKKNNLSGETVQRREPIKKRYRTRSLSYAEPSSTDAALGQANLKQNDEIDEDDIATASLGSKPRSRSNTLESFQNALVMGRSRSDTIDFLTAAVAGDMGHDLDAAMAVVTEGGSFVQHPISAPSGASLSYQPSTRSRSNTLDSTASSVNSSKLDFLISVAVEEGAEFGLLTEERIRDRTESTSETSADVQRRPRSNTLEMYSTMAAGRGRSDTIDFLMGSGHDNAVGSLEDVLPDDNTTTGCVMDHLKALCGEPAVSSANKTTGILRRGRLSSGAGETSHANTTKRTRANSDNTNPSNSAGSSSQRMVMEALQHFESDKRDRNDSWGGMSDLSFTGIAATHDALKSTGIIDDIMAAAADIGDDLSEEPPGAVQRKRTGSGGTNSLSGKGRPRLDSLASLSLASLSDASISVSGRKEQYASELVQKQTSAESKISTPGSQSIVVDYDAITAAVNAANAATEGLDLNSILSSSTTTKPSTAVDKSKKPSVLPTGRAPITSAKITVSKPLPPKLLPIVSKSMPPKGNTLPKLAMRPTQTPITLARPFPTKYQTTHLTKAKSPPLSTAAQQAAAKRAAAASQPGLPSAKLLPGLAAGQKPKPPVPSSIDIPIPKSTKTEAEMEAIRQRARAAAGYVPPVPGSMIPQRVTSLPMKMPPPGKTPPFPQPRPGGAHPSFVPSMPRPPGYMSHPVSRVSSVQSAQKWDDMFQYLVKFIEETRIEQTKGLTEEQKALWVWDGNVPTNYKTKCGKALGRWINNQRTSKTKGTLKDDREVRLVSTGLKWSVLTTNSWNEMLHELKLYAEEKRQGGRRWDGNVPTSHKIVVERAINGRKIEEEKNLGRWVNRQRSLYQAGKLKPERQVDLERVGLKWSVLVVASWSSMYEHLCAYARDQRARNNGTWDGDVPQNFRIESRPPANLGRWVNRQRSAHARGRLKHEFVVKLEQIGLKWSMSDEQLKAGDFDDEDFEGEEFTRLPERVLSTSLSFAHALAAGARAAPKPPQLLTPTLVVSSSPTQASAAAAVHPAAKAAASFSANSAPVLSSSSQPASVAGKVSSSSSQPASIAGKVPSSTLKVANPSAKTTTEA